MQTLQHQQAVLSLIRGRWLEPDEVPPTILETCSDCKEDIEVGKEFYNVKGKIICSDCIEKYKRDCFSEGYENQPNICSDCNEDVEGDSFYVIEGELICENCLSKYRID